MGWRYVQSVTDVHINDLIKNQYLGYMSTDSLRGKKDLEELKVIIPISSKSELILLVSVEACPWILFEI